MLIFEYMEIEVVKVCIMLVIVGLIFIGSLSLKTHTLKCSIKLLLVFAFVLPFAGSLYSIAISDKNVKFFKDAKELECTSDKFKFLVSQSNNWILKDDNFVKESLMIRADKCEFYKL